jgi:ATP-dependent RecD-like DNA helicase SH3 domain
MHRGLADPGVLNERLQAALTPPRDGLPERRFGGRVYRVGDRVMQLRNNCDEGTAGVFNGSVGVVTALSLEDQELRFLSDVDEEVAYGFDELDELTHAYAVSVHPFPGQRDACVVVPLTTSAWLMLQWKLPYTGVTRPSESSSWLTAGAPWPRPSAPRAPDAATPPSPNGSSSDGTGPLRQRQSAGRGTGGCNRSRSSPRSGSAIGSGRRDGQGNARAAHRVGHPGVQARPIE